MPSEFSVYDSGAWRSIYDAHVRVGTTWNRIQNGYVYTGSAWSNFYNYDITGPVAATNLLAHWSNGYGAACYVTWNQPTDADFSYSLLKKSTNGINGSYTTVATKTEGPGVAASYLDFGVTLGTYAVHNAVNQASTSAHYYRVVPYDDKGNQGTIVTAGSTSYAGGPVRGYLSSPYYFNSNGSASWLWGNNSWAGGVSQGYQDVYGNGRRFGHFFYDNSTFHTLNVSSAGILMRRQSGAGINNGILVGTRGSYADAGYAFLGAEPVSALATGTTFSGAFSYGTLDWATVGDDVATQIVANGYNSVVIDAEEDYSNTGYGYSSRYSTWDDQTVDLYGNILFGGTLRIYHSG
jgi:hypothetical protein